MAIRQEIYVEKAKGYTTTGRGSSVARDARTAAEKAKAKGWQTWSTTDQCDVLDMATVISQKPNTNWYFVLRLVEEQEQVWKVQADSWKDVTNAWLRYQSALEPSECWEY
jgi:hypothetical protein